MIYGEDSGWLRNGTPLGGSEPEAPSTLRFTDLVILRSGFALRDDDLWRRAMQLDLCEYHHCSVASLPSTIISF